MQICAGIYCSAFVSSHLYSECATPISSSTQKVALQDTSDSRCRDETIASKEKNYEKTCYGAIYFEFHTHGHADGYPGYGSADIPHTLGHPGTRHEDDDAHPAWHRVTGQSGDPPRHADGKKTAMEAPAIEILRGEPQMRAEFINRVAPPIVNKLFECGMIPCSLRA